MNMGRKTCRAQLHRSLRAQHRCAPTALLRPAAPRQRCFAPLLSEVEFLKEMPGRDERCSAFACAVAPPLRAAPLCLRAALLRPPPQRSCALKDNWRRRGCRRQYTRGFGGRPPWVAAQSGVALSDTANAALRQPPLPNPTGPSTSISIALPCRSAALRNDNSELSNITHCVKKYSPSALVITHCVMRPSQAVARPCLHRNGAMVCSKGAQ